MKTEISLLLIITLVLTLYTPPAVFSESPKEEMRRLFEERRRQLLEKRRQLRQEMEKRGGGALTWPDERGPAPPEPKESAPERPERAKASSDGGENVSLFFDDADIFEVAHTIFGEILKVNYMIDPRVRGRITFRSVRPVRKADLLPIVSMLFRLNGVSIIEEAGVYRIIPLVNVSREPAEVGFGRSSEGLKVEGRSLIQIVPLNFVEASEMMTILEPFLSEGATMVEVPGKNCLIIADTDENLRRLLSIVETFDDELFEDVKVEMFVFKNLNVRDVIEDLKGAFPLIFSAEKESLKVRLITVEKLNALLVIAPSERYLEHVRKWVGIIDSTFEGARPRIYVYPLQNSKAEHVASILQKIFFGGQTSGPSVKAKVKGATPGKKKTAKTRGTTSGRKTTPAGKGLSYSPLEESLLTPGTGIFHDEVSNSLIILALPRDYPLITEVIKKLDQVPRQVLIEALVAEVTLTDKLQFGIEWFLQSKFDLNRLPLTGISGFGSSSLSFDPSAPLSESGFTFALIDSADLVRGLLQSLATESRVRVIASPHIMASDNREAKIQVGKQVPVQTSTSVTSGGETVYSVQYRDTGVVLTVKPRINDGGLVSLEITQEVSSVDPEAGVAGNPIISNRMAETNVVVQDGQTVVIGGLIQENTGTTREGIPLLMDIPVLGGLFGYSTDSTERTELIVLLTPRVVSTIDEAGVVTEEFRKKLKGLRDLFETGGQTPPSPAPEETTPEGGSE